MRPVYANMETYTGLFVYFITERRMIMSEKKKGGLILVLILAVIDVILAVVIVKGFIDAKTPGETVPDTVTTTERQTYPTEPAEPTDDVAEAVSETTEAPVSETTEQTTEADTTVTEPTEAPTQETATEKIDYSTDARPSDNDFTDWYAKDVMWYGVPDGVTRITELSDILGGWKGLIYYDPENTEGSEAVELLNFRVGEGQYGLTLTADWYSMFWVADGAAENEEDMDDFDFPAYWENGQLKGDRDSVIIFTDFYEKDGRQYACGYMETASGIPAKVAMVRP